MNKQSGISAIAIVLLVIIFGGATWFLINQKEDKYVTPKTEQEVSTETKIEEDRDFGDDGLEDSDGKGGTLTEPVSLGTVKSYTLADVSTHNNSTDCWTVVNGSVYDVTSWISRHPGGQNAIKSMCGVDASSSFNGQHGGGQARPASELSGFKIGVLR